MSLRSRALLCILTFVVGACGADVEPSLAPPSEPGPGEGIFFPTRAPEQKPVALPLAEADGILTTKHGCLWVTTAAGQDYLMIWPAGFRLVELGARLGVADDSGQTVAIVGLPISVVGAAYEEGSGPENVSAQVESMIGAPIPDPCRGDQYWVGSVRARGA